MVVASLFPVQLPIHKQLAMSSFSLQQEGATTQLKPENTTYIHSVCHLKLQSASRSLRQGLLCVISCGQTGSLQFDLTPRLRGSLQASRKHLVPLYPLHIQTGQERIELRCLLHSQIFFFKGSLAMRSDSLRQYMLCIPNLKIQDPECYRN